MRQNGKAAVACLFASGVFPFITTPAHGQAAPYSTSGPFFDFGLPDKPGKPGQPGFAPAPFLDNNAASAASVSALLASRQASGLLLAVKVRQPLTDPAAINVFNNFRVQYVFADFEDAARVGRTRSLADQVAASAKSSGALERKSVV